MRQVFFSILVSLLATFAIVAQQPARDATELKRLLNEFLAGAARNDVAVHDRFWADDLIYTRSAGQRISKSELMQGVRSAAPSKPGDAVTSYGAEDIRIQQYGNAAVVAFRLVGTTQKDGKIQVSKFLNTGVFVRRKGKWQVVAWQATAIPAQSNK